MDNGCHFGSSDPFIYAEIQTHISIVGDVNIDAIQGFLSEKLNVLVYRITVKKVSFQLVT
jgi:hypothetical protein